MKWVDDRAPNNAKKARPVLQRHGDTKKSFIIKILYYVKFFNKLKILEKFSNPNTTLFKTK